VLELLEAEEEAEDSILCVNMLPGLTKEEGDDSVVCVDLEGDATEGATTPASAV
jgi:hypothetical protein